MPAFNRLSGFPPQQALRLARILRLAGLRLGAMEAARFFPLAGQLAAAGIGASQLTLNEWAISSGGHARTGLEDNVRLDRDTLAPSNAALVRRAAGLCQDQSRR